MEKLKIAQAVIVEGKYDKIKLSSILDAVMITTEGFGVFKNRETAGLIRKYASTTGIVILTDSDAAGFRIRSHIKSICPGGKITNIYIPDVFGKEKRKTEPSKEGKLGVEGLDAALLRELFEKADILTGESPCTDPVTVQELYELGLVGADNSSELRRKTARLLGLPERISAKGLIEATNSVFGREKLTEAISKVKEEGET